MLNIEEFAKEGTLFDGRYKLLRALNTEGGTADVWLAIDENTVDGSVPSDEDSVVDESASVEDSGIVVAIKIYRCKNALDIEGEQRFRNEYKIVFNCHHTNLLQPINFSIFKETPYLVLPYCKAGSSELLIGKDLSENDIWKYILDVSSGLAYLHACNPPIIHQDIKPANVLMDEYHNYAITDFGISSKRGNVGGYYGDEENSGTLAYMAPERFTENYIPMPESDIWALGATLYEIITGNVPYGENGGESQLDDSVQMSPIGKNISSEIQRIISMCLAKDPKERPTAAQLAGIAEARKYAINSKGKYLKYVAAACILSIVGLLFAILGKSEKATVTADEVYREALACMNSSSLDTVQAGLKRMDSLAYANYVPALYELAYTYGWYSDSVSVQRKRKLGIAFYMDGSDKYLPKSYEYNNKATGLLSRIIELNDTTYPEINANAMYRLACYYVNTDKVYNPNYGRAKELLLQSEYFAVLVNDTMLLRRIRTAIKQLEQTNK
ncbi:serine/threonine-protein kinase [Phocaeicola sp.]